MLPLDVIITRVFRERNIPDPAELVVLRAVSCGRRDAPVATGRKVEQLTLFVAAYEDV